MTARGVLLLSLLFVGSVGGIWRRPLTDPSASRGSSLRLEDLRRRAEAPWVRLSLHTAPNRRCFFLLPRISANDWLRQPLPSFRWVLVQFWWLLDRALSLQVKQEKEVLSGEPSTKLAIGMRRLGRDLGTSPGKKNLAACLTSGHIWMQLT